MKELTGGGSASPKLPPLPSPTALRNSDQQEIFSQQIIFSDLLDADPTLIGMPYEIWNKSTETLIASGTISKDGLSSRVYTNSKEELVIILGEPTWALFEQVEGPSHTPSTKEYE